MDRYTAFISYSHSDQHVARWLHRAIEGYRFPRALVGTPSAFGPVPRRLPPLFRDRDELPASGDLGTELRGALAASRFQIVLCSPRAAASKWVNEEILSFKRVHGENRTLALIVGGEPYTGDERECFPPALRFKLGPDGQLSDDPAEPIAADIRPGKDGRRLALLKLLAGLSGTQLDGLVRRDAARRQRRLMIVTGASLTVAVVTIGLAIYAEAQRREAVRQRQLADRSLEFLVGTFAIANPATENPRTITALTVLDRASKRAAVELGDEPAVSARLLRTTGEIYFNLGLQAEAEHDLRKALALEPARSEGRARALLKLASLAGRRSDTRAMVGLIDQAEVAFDRRAANMRDLAAQAQGLRGRAAYLEGRYAAAASLYAEAAGNFAELDGDFREERGQLLMNEAEALIQLRKPAEAKTRHVAATALYISKFGTNDVHTAVAINNEALGDVEAGQYANAEKNLARANAIFERVLEPDHPSIATSQIMMGRVRAKRGNLAGALAAFDRARAIFARLYGADNAAVGDVDFYAGEALGQAANLPAALQRFANTKRIYDASYGPDDPDQAELLLARSRAFAAAKRQAEARQNCEAGLALQIRLKSAADLIAATRKSCAALASTR